MNADFRDVTLHKAKFAGANLMGANFMGARGLADADFVDAIGLDMAVFPADFRPPVGAIPLPG